MATSFSGGRSRSIRREPPTMVKQLVSFIICGVLVIGLYELLRNPTTYLIEPLGLWLPTQVIRGTYDVHKKSS